MNPDNGYTKASLLFAQICKGDYEEALRFYEKMNVPYWISFLLLIK